MSKQCIVVGTRYCSFLHSDKLLLPLAEFSPLEISHTESHPENWQNILVERDRFRGGPVCAKKMKDFEIPKFRMKNIKLNNHSVNAN